MPVHNKIGGDAGQKAINEAGDLATGDDLWVDELSVQVEDEVDDLSRVHALLDVASQGDFIDAKLLTWKDVQLVFKTELGWLVLDAKVDRDD